MTWKELKSTLRWKLAWYANSVDSEHPAYYWNIEPTSACNLRCTICSLDDSRRKGLMDMTLYEKLLGEAARMRVTEIRLFLAGEPLIHPRIAEMVRMAADRGFRTSIHTNATHLTRELSRDLIEARLAYLSFSFDGDNREEYERIRFPAKFDKVLGNILGFLETKKALGSRTPHTTFQSVRPFDPGRNGPTPLSPEFMAQFDGLPLDHVRLLTPHNWAGEVSDVPGARPPGTRYVQCRTAWESMSIGWDGRVLNCCGDLNGKVVLGDLKKQTAEEVWRGPLRELRRALANKERLSSLTLCNRCDAPWRRRHPVVTELADVTRIRNVVAPLRMFRPKATPPDGKPTES